MTGVYQVMDFPTILFFRFARFFRGVGDLAGSGTFLHSGSWGMKTSFSSPRRISKASWLPPSMTVSLSRKAS